MGGVPRELWGSQTGGPPPRAPPCCPHMLLQEHWMGRPPNVSPSSSGVGEQLAGGVSAFVPPDGDPCPCFFPKSSRLGDAEALHSPRWCPQLCSEIAAGTEPGWAELGAWKVGAERG